MSLPLSFRPVARTFTSSALKYAASSSRAAPVIGIDAFKDGQHAEFVAAAVSSSALPDLRGLPEVSIVSCVRGGNTTFTVVLRVLCALGLHAGNCLGLVTRDANVNHSDRLLLQVRTYAYLSGLYLSKQTLPRPRQRRQINPAECCR